MKHSIRLKIYIVQFMFKINDLQNIDKIESEKRLGHNFKSIQNHMKEPGAEIPSGGAPYSCIFSKSCINFYLLLLSLSNVFIISFNTSY